MQALSNTVWALSKLAAPGERDEALLDAVAGAMLPALPEFNAQNVANTVRSFLRIWFTRCCMQSLTPSQRTLLHVGMLLLSAQLPAQRQGTLQNHS